MSMNDLSIKAFTDELAAKVSVPGGGRMSYLRVSRATNVMDLIGIQIGYTHYIQPKKR